MKSVPSSPLLTSLLRLPLCVAALLCGCADNPFPNEESEYAIAFIIDKSWSYQDDLAAMAFAHFVRVKESLFRDVMGTDTLVIFSKINGDGTPSVLFEGSPRAFIEKFPTKESFLDFINQIPSGSSPVFTSCAETIERLCRRHQDHPRLHSILLIYSDMQDTHGGEDQLAAAARRYAVFPSAIGVYGAHESWADYFRQCGVRHCVAYDDKRADPPLPEIP